MPGSEETNTANDAIRRGAFSHLSVVEIGDAPAGAYCGKLFADYGAEVTVVGAGPPGPGAAFYGSSKGEAVVSPELLDQADIIIQASSIDPIAKPIQPVRDDQIIVRISPFALDGPYAQWRSTDLVDAAVAGHLRLSGDPDREPLQGVPDLVHHAAGVTAFVASVGALITRVRTGCGQVVETSHQEVIVALHQFTLCRYTFNGAVLQRLGNRYAGPGSPIGAYECADGWIGLALPQDDQLERMLDVTGLITMLDRPEVESIWDLMTQPGLLDSELVPYLKSQRRDETVELFQALRLPCAPVAELNDVLEDPHLADRDFWAEHPDRALRLPGAPFRMSSHDWSVGPKQRDSALPVGQESVDDLVDGPLTGLRVIDMTRIWAGPLATRILADLGAEVLMTEVPWTRTSREVPQSYVDGTHFFPDDEAGEQP